MNEMNKQLQRLRDWIEAPSLVELGEYLLGLLPEDQRQEIEYYLETHPEAHDELERLRAYIDDWDVGWQEDRWEADGSEAVAPPVTPGRDYGRALLEPVRRLIASLRPPDLLSAAPAYGLRGDSDRVLVYEVEGIEITLDVQSDMRGRFALVGSVINTDYTDLKAYLYADNHLVTEAEVDELGDFSIDDLAAGRYGLILDGPHFNLRCNPDIEVGAA